LVETKVPAFAGATELCVRSEASTVLRKFAALALRRVRELFCVLALCVAAPVWSQTTVGGVISVNATWRAADSPFVVGTDVIVQNGAVLTIEPGVQIFMGTGRALTVQGGSIQALGTSAQPILVSADTVRTGGAGVPGAWGRWTFASGTTNTRLEHVTFEYGNGLAVNGSAPVFNFLTVRNHAAAAITVDLAASPSGVGNQATGNVQNAILVPAGDIAGNVTWGLRGIPYLVSGTLSVGASPTIASVTPTVIEQGETLTLTVTGSRLTGAVAASFEAQGLTAQLLPGATATQLQLSVAAAEDAVVGTTALRVLVDAGDARRSAALNVIGPQFRLSSVVPSTVYVGQGDAQVQLNGSRFNSSAVALLAGVQVPTTFVSSTRLLATIPNQTTTAALALAVRIPDPDNAGSFLTSNDVPLSIVTPQLALAPATATIINGTTHTLTLTLPYPAGAGGQTINLVSSVPGVASVPPSISIAAGATSASIPVSTVSTGNTTITASRTGYTSAQAVVTVIPPPSLSISPSTLTIGAGRSASLTITSSAPAPSGGLTIGLSSSNTAIATLAPSITLSAGATSGQVILTSVAIGTATISAQAPGYLSGSMPVSVRPVSLNFPAGAAVAPGLSRSVPLTLSDPAPAGGLVVSLASSNSGVLTVPASITVPAGATAANIVVTGVSAGTASVTASANGYEAGTLSVSVEVINISLGVTSTSIPVGMTHMYVVSLSRPAPAGGVSIALAVTNPALATVTPAVVEIPAGQTSGGVVRAQITAVATGTTTVTAQADGLATSSVNLTVTARPTLSFNDTTMTLGRGFRNYEFETYVQLRTGTAPYNPPSALTIALTSSDPTRASVPATVTIPAGQNNVYFQTTGVELTAGTPVTIDASADGYTSPATRITVNVIQPQLTVQSLETPRSVGASRDSFTVRVNVPGSDNATLQRAPVNTVVDLSLLDPQPAGIVDGFYIGTSGGNPITQLTIPVNDSVTGTAYVGSPTAAGTYRVQAISSTTGAVGTSGLITVTQPELRFSDTTLTVGRGVRNYEFEVYVYRAVNGSAFNGASALTVSLTSSDPTRVTVPATVTIPANQSNVYFQVTGVDLTSGTPVTIDASAQGYTSPPTRASVNVVTPQLVVQSFETTRSVGATRDAITTRLNVPGADNASLQRTVAALPIDLAIASAEPANIVEGFYSAVTGGTAVTQVTIPVADSTSTTAHVGSPTAAGTYRIQASSTALGATGLSGVVTVTPPELRFSDTTITVGRGFRNYEFEVYVYRAVNGNAFNGVNPVTVNLTSSDPTRASVPATVTIPANQSNVYFTITGVDLTAGTPVTISASADGHSSPTSLINVNVVHAQFVPINLESPRSPASPRDPFQVRASVPGADNQNNQSAASNIVIDLAAVEQTPAGIVDGFYSAATGGAAITQVTLPAGNTTTANIYVGTPTVAGTYRVQASVPSLGVSTLSGFVTVTAPELRFSDTSLTVGRGLRNYQFEVYVYRAVNGNSFNGTAPVTVNLSCSSTTICSVPATVTIPANESLVYFTVSGLALGTTTITASATGYSSVQDANVTVVTPSLRFSGLATTVARGANDAFTVGMNTPGADNPNNQTPLQPLVVSLTSSAPDVGTVPTTVTIPTNDNVSPNVNFSGLSGGTTTVTASSAGFTSASQSVTVSP
jgi:trimeric autotransporter adhesin